MDSSRKDTAESKSINKALPQNTNNLTNTFVRTVDASPGTSGHCNRSSSSKLKDHSDHGKADKTDVASLQSIESFVCRICHNSENPEKLISPCICKGSLACVHSDCLERWISMSRCTACELCQFQYNTQQTLRYTFYQSLRLWYSRSMSRRALQEDCQMFLLLTLIAFGIVGTLLVAVQYYILKGQINGLGRTWTKGWLIFFLFTTLTVYLINVYMIVKSQLMPWYRWWQSARDIHLILENHKSVCAALRQTRNDGISNSSTFVEEDSIGQNVKTTVQQNGQNIFPEGGPACRNNTKSLKTFNVRGNDNYFSQVKVLKENYVNKLQMARLEPAFDTLTEAV